MWQNTVLIFVKKNTGLLFDKQHTVLLFSQNTVLIFVTKHRVILSHKTLFKYHCLISVTPTYHTWLLLLCNSSLFWPPAVTERKAQGLGQSALQTWELKILCSNWYLLVSNPGIVLPVTVVHISLLCADLVITRYPGNSAARYCPSQHGLGSKHEKKGLVLETVFSFLHYFDQSLIW